MDDLKQNRVSLKWGLMTAIVMCWLAAMIIVVSIAGILLNNNFEANLEDTVKRDAENILAQISIRLSDCMESSKEVSYDGVIRSAYRKYLSDGDNIGMYRTMTQYLSGSFSRDIKFKAVFISFWEPEFNSRIYVINQKDNSYQILQNYISQVRPDVLNEMVDADTQIRFLIRNGEIFICRNLLDSGFRPYATVTMLCDKDVLLQPLQSLMTLSDTAFSIDGTWLKLDEQGALAALDHSEFPSKSDSYFVSVDGHEFAFYVAPTSFHIWTDMPGLQTAVAAASALVLPILFVMISIFYKTVSEPVQILVDASQRVQDGERGYQIEKSANNREFQQLYGQFNIMSRELQSQFERSRMEQQTLQQAKIKALQSQINPHFLNNTLEVINWEARIAGNDNVSEMIDALSTMLEAALDRDGTSTVTIQHEINYANAYLRIIQKRLGQRFQTCLEVEPELLPLRVPKLILQPLVENAVEHDITPHKGGNLAIHIYKKSSQLVLEVIHDGTMTDADAENVSRILAAAESNSVPKGKHVGLGNVAMRLKLLYGERSSIQIKQTAPGIVTAQVNLPLDLPI